MKIRSVTADIFLIWTNVTWTNVARTCHCDTCNLFKMIQGAYLSSLVKSGNNSWDIVPKVGGGLIGTLSQIFSFFYFDACPNEWNNIYSLLSYPYPLKLLPFLESFYVDFCWNTLINTFNSNLIVVENHKTQNQIKFNWANPFWPTLLHPLTHQHPGHGFESASLLNAWEFHFQRSLFLFVELSFNFSFN